MHQLNRLLRAVTSFVEELSPSHDRSRRDRLAAQVAAASLEPFIDETGDADWRRWYDTEDEEDGVPLSVINACFDEVREASMLHTVALLEIARKWGFDPRQ